MVVSVLLFSFYLLVFLLILYKSKFVQTANIPFTFIVAFFIIKIVAGCAYGYIHYNSNYGALTDTWKFYFQSIHETTLLKQNPVAFLQHIFGNGYQNGGEGMLITTNSYWNDLKHNIMLFGMSICNVFTNNNYYINIIFYNAFTFFGLIAFYKFCFATFLIPKKLLLIIVFCVPSFVFWTSGFHKEGLLFTAMSFLLYSIFQIMQNRKIALHSIIILLAVAFLFILRNYILLFFIPFLITWVLVQKLRYKKEVFMYSLTSLFIILVFFMGKKLNTKLDLPKYTVTAQKDFLALHATTKIKVDTVQPTFKSFSNNFWQAIHTGFLQPNFNSLKLTYLPALLDNLLIILLLVINIYYFKNWKSLQNTSLLFLFTSIFIFLFLGYSVPIVGAIIRYKAIFLPFVYIALLQRFQLSKILKNQ